MKKLDKSFSTIIANDVLRFAGSSNHFLLFCLGIKGVGSITKKSGGCADWLISSLYFILRWRLNFPR